MAMRMNSGEIFAYASILDKELSGKRLSKCVHFDNGVFAFAISNKQSLVFVLNGNEPRVYISPTSFALPSLSSALSTQLRKVASGGKINKIETINDDSILAIRFSSIDDLYQERKYSLVAELIPFKGNLILLDEDDNVLSSVFTLSLESPRPLFRGLKYAPPEKAEVKNKEAKGFDYEAFLNHYIEEEDDLFEKRKKNQFKPLYDKAKRTIKNLNNRLKMIDKDEAEAKNHLNDGDYGNFIFMNIDSIDLESGFMDYYGEKVPLNKTLSLAKNAENFFKRAKKAKLALEYSEERRKKTIEELKEANDFLLLLEYSSEEDLARYEKENGPRKRNKGVKGSAYMPFESFIDGVRFVYGKNSRQNDFLMSYFSHKGECLWIHPKQGAGAHVVIDKANPSNKEINDACMLCLALSHLDIGEVMVAKMKEIHKGKNIGQAVLNHYVSYFIRDIAPYIEEAISSGRKIAHE